MHGCHSASSICLSSRVGALMYQDPVSIRTTLKANKEEMETAQCLAGEPLTVHVPYLNSKLSGSVPF